MKEAGYVIGNLDATIILEAREKGLARLVNPPWRGESPLPPLFRSHARPFSSSLTRGKQTPKLSPHKEKIRANLALLCEADPSVINIKAKTHEKVDSLGENRSISAHTVVLLIKVAAPAPAAA